MLLAPRSALTLLLALPLAVAGCGSGNDDAKGTSGTAAATGGALRERAIQKGLPSVVAVTVSSNGITRNGTGTLVATDTVITDGALVTSPGGLPSAGVTVREASGEEHAGVVDGVDELTGLAALRVRGLEAVPVAAAATAEPALAAEVVGLGYLSARRPAVRDGSVVTLGRAIREGGNSEVGLFETTAPLGAQGYGGPIVGQDGRVLGIATRALAPIVPGSVLALPVKTALRVAKALESDGQVRRAYLGAATVGISPTRAQELRLTTSSGVLLRAVAAGSPASFSTLRKPTGSIDIGGRAIPTGGDVITRIDRIPVKEPEDLEGAVAEMKPGQKVTLTVIRGQESVAIHVTLGEH